MNPLISAFKRGLEKAGIEPARVAVVSDIPFEPEVVKELGVDYFHCNRGRAIAFGTGLKLANPSLTVVPFTGDLMTLGGNHFVHGGRRNMELTVICVNNFVYRKVDGAAAPRVTGKFSPFAGFEEPFNAPHLANSCGAVYTARWTAKHVEELSDSLAATLNRRGFSVIEVVCPGPDFYTGVSSSEPELLDFYFSHSVIKHGEEPRNAAITGEDKIVVGNFTVKEKTPYLDQYNAQLSKVLGDKFIPYGVEHV